MNKNMLTRTALILTFLVLFCSFSPSVLSVRTIHLAGLIIDAADLSPVKSAQIYDAENHLLGSSDEKGYYNIAIAYAKTGEMIFSLKIKKQGFQNFTQNEHWGNLADPENIMYFGLKRSHTASRSFSAFADGPIKGPLSYETVAEHFGKVKKQKVFNDKLAAAKAGNQDVLVRVDNQFYIVDENGWILINSDKDLISINDKKLISADKLNSTIKRSSVKGMSPVDKKDAKFVIYTR
jgi:hypothetical protein